MTNPETPMTLDSIMTLLKGFAIESVSHYGNYSSSFWAINAAASVTKMIFSSTGQLPVVVKADGVILKYPRGISVEVDNQAAFLILDRLNNNYEYVRPSSCARKVAALMGLATGTANENKESSRNQDAKRAGKKKAITRPNGGGGEA